MPYGTGAPRIFSGSARGMNPIGSLGQGVYAKGQQKPKTNSLANYLGTDVDYKNTINDLTQNFQSYKTQSLTNRGNLKLDFGDTKTRLQQDQDDAFKKMQDDYGARGLLGSGLYLDALNRFNLDHQNQMTDASTSYSRNLTQLLTDLANAKTMFQQQKKDAKLSAIRRRAEKYGLR